jgi:hypothetical protein
VKKILPTLLLLITILVIWLYLANRTVPKSPVPKANSAETASNAPNSSMGSHSTNTVDMDEPMNAMMATNLEQWKEAIKGLGKLRGFADPEHWLVEQPGRKTGLPIVLSIGGQTVEYSAVLISVNAKAGSGQVVQVDLQSPNMNIDDTREMGLQLYRMMGLDPSEFIAWCNQVGNHWMDSTLFDSMAARIPNSNKFYGFGLLHSYSDEKPWVIDFSITAR